MICEIKRRNIKDAPRGSTIFDFGASKVFARQRKSRTGRRAMAHVTIRTRNECGVTIKKTIFAVKLLCMEIPNSMLGKSTYKDGLPQKSSNYA